MIHSNILMTTHLFNPENDLALAADIDRYTPPAAAIALSRSGSLIPAWITGSGDRVLVRSEHEFREAENLRRQFGLNFEATETVPSGCASFSPWGWSRHARRQFINAGANTASLPDDAWLQRQRMLSSRSTTVDLCNHLGIEPPETASTVEKAVAAVANNLERGRHSYLKMPWSSSGRGVFPTARMKAHLIERRASDIIRSQGFVIIEPDRCRKADFASLYHVAGGEARFHALSVFETDSRGAYRGNLIVSDDDIISRLGTDPMPWAEKMAYSLTAVIAPFYSGCAGVDMVVTHNGDVYPCIELNLRTTMGVIAAAMRPYFGQPMLLAPSPGNPQSHLPVAV